MSVRVMEADMEGSQLAIAGAYTLNCYGSDFTQQKHSPCLHGIQGNIGQVAIFSML